MMNVLENIGGIHAITVPQTGLSFHPVSDNLLDDICWMSHSSVFYAFTRILVYEM